MRFLVVLVLITVVSNARALKSQRINLDLDSNGYADIIELTFNADSTLAGLKVTLQSLDQNDDVVLNKIFDRKDLFLNLNGFSEATLEDLPNSKFLVSLPFEIDGQKAQKTFILKVKNQKVLISQFSFYQVSATAEQFNCSANLETGEVEQSVYRPVAVPRTIKFDTFVRTPELSAYNDSEIPEFCKRKI